MPSVLIIIFSILPLLGFLSYSIANFCEHNVNTEKTKGAYKHLTYFKKIGDVFLACFIISLCFINMLIPIDSLRDTISQQDEIELIMIRRITGLFLISFIVCFGAGGAFVGCLSIFQSNLTRFKRVILLTICLLPLVFAILHFIISPISDVWSLTKLGAMYSGICWITNGPSIVLGKHWFELSSILAQKISSHKKT